MSDRIEATPPAVHACSADARPSRRQRRRQARGWRRQQVAGRADTLVQPAPLRRAILCRSGRCGVRFCAALPVDGLV
eukprot:5962916-Pleurochrysis_carterae.AAC.2